MASLRVTARMTFALSYIFLLSCCLILRSKARIVSYQFLDNKKTSRLVPQNGDMSVLLPSGLPVNISACFSVFVEYNRQLGCILFHLPNMFVYCLRYDWISFLELKSGYERESSLEVFGGKNQGSIRLSLTLSLTVQRRKFILKRRATFPLEESADELSFNLKWISLCIVWQFAQSKVANLLM